MRSISKAITALAITITVGSVMGGIAKTSEASVSQSQIDHVAKSLVWVKYTAENEFKKSTKLRAQGIILNKQGVVMVTSALFPAGLPLSYFHHLKIKLPFGRMKTVPAKYLGRSPDGVMCYVKALKPLHLPPLKIDHPVEVRLGERVYSIGRLNKNLAYKPYIGINRVKILLRQVRWEAGVEVFGLTDATSPVYVLHNGDFAGITIPSTGDAVELSILGHSGPVNISDPLQTGIFLPWDSVENYIKDAPLHRTPVQTPWLGTMDSTGLKKAVRKLYHIKQISGVMIGRVIPGMPAAKAGLKSQDIVLTMNGKPVSRSPLPSFMLASIERKIFACKPGMIVHLGVLRNGTKHLNITVKVGVQPISGARMPRYFNHKLGVVVRNLAFFDLYNRKLSQKQKGVMVSLIRNGAPAGLGNTPLQAGYIITRINNKKVDNVKQFAQMVAADLKTKNARSMVFEVINSKGNTAVCHIRLH